MVVICHVEFCVFIHLYFIHICMTLMDKGTTIEHGRWLPSRIPVEFCCVCDTSYEGLFSFCKCIVRNFCYPWSRWGLDWTLNSKWLSYAILNDLVYSSVQYPRVGHIEPVWFHNEKFDIIFVIRGYGQVKIWSWNSRWPFEIIRVFKICAYTQLRYIELVCYHDENLYVAFCYY